jgi:hypothetical protein
MPVYTERTESRRPDHLPSLDVVSESGHRSFAEPRAAFTCRPVCSCRLQVTRRLGRRASVRPLVGSCKELGGATIQKSLNGLPYSVPNSVECCSSPAVF